MRPRTRTKPGPNLAKTKTKPIVDQGLNLGLNKTKPQLSTAQNQN